MKKTPPIALPPLSVETLANIQIVERATTSTVKECAGLDFDLSRAIRNLRSFAVAAFNWQINYYGTLPEFSPDWSVAIVEETVEIIMGAIPRGTQSLLSDYKSKIKKAILATLAEHVLSLASKRPKGRSRDKTTTSFEPFSPRLDKAVAVLDIRHDELARRMGIPKTTYFALKRGDGKTSTKFKMDAYLKNLNKSNPDTVL